MDSASKAQIVASLELAAAGGDLTPAVYERLFKRYPEMSALFARDADGLVRGEMLARVYEMVLDYAGDGAYAAGMIRNEVVTHAGYDVPAEIFPLFFEVVLETLRAAAGAAWTPAMTAAWTAMLADFKGFAGQPG